MRQAQMTVIFALLSAAGALAAAEDVRLWAEVDAREIGTEDHLQLTLSVSGRQLGPGDELSLPTFKNLKVVGGPMRSTQVSYVNGAVSQVSSQIFTLVATAAGKAEIGAARLRMAGGGERTSEPIAINVVAGSVRPRSRAGADPFGQDPFFGNDPFGDDAFGQLFRRRSRQTPTPKIAVDVAVSRAKLYVGEALRIVYRVYTQASLRDVAFAEEPQYPGFWAEDLERPSGGARGQSVTFEGERYLRFDVREKLLFPAKAGRLTIPAARMRIRMAAFSPFDPAPEVLRESKSTAVDVTAIPDEPGFSGAVGDFKASAAVDRSALALGDAVTLRFTLRGRGNLRWVERGPELSMPNVKVFPPQVKDAIKVDEAGMAGTRTWEYVLVPQTAGRIELPALGLPYFDARTGRLARAAAGPLTLEVTGGAATTKAGEPVAAAGGLALRTDLDRPSAGQSLIGPRGLVGLAALVLLAHVGLWAGARWRHGWAPVSRGAGRGGVRAALADIERAKRKGTSKEQAALLIEKALTDVYGALDDAAQGAGSAQESAALLVLNEVRFLRYAPQLGDYTDKIREVAARAASVVRKGA